MKNLWKGISILGIWGTVGFMTYMHPAAGVLALIPAFLATLAVAGQKA